MVVVGIHLHAKIIWKYAIFAYLSSSVVEMTFHIFKFPLSDTMITSPLVSETLYNLLKCYLFYTMIMNISMSICPIRSCVSDGKSATNPVSPNTNVRTKIEPTCLVQVDYKLWWRSFVYICFNYLIPMNMILCWFNAGKLQAKSNATDVIRRKQKILGSERDRAHKRAVSSFRSENPFFSIVMQPSYIDGRGKLVSFN